MGQVGGVLRGDRAAESCGHRPHERLNNPDFRDGVLPALTTTAGMLVVDEAYCISDWRHDFRPDYRRVRTLLRELPDGVPVLAPSALGMGFDKPDLGFVVHLGAPASPIAYDQQVGRTERGLRRAEVILLPGPEDRDI